MSDCPYSECDGSGKISYVEREPEDTRVDLGHGLYAGPTTTHGSRLCRCRIELEPREGEAAWWDSQTIFEQEWAASVFGTTATVKVTGEIPIDGDNYKVNKRGNRYYPCFVDLGNASFIFPDEARELARLLNEAADACDAYDKPDTNEDGSWWFPQIDGERVDLDESPNERVAREDRAAEVRLRGEERVAELEREANK